MMLCALNTTPYVSILLRNVCQQKEKKKSKKKETTSDDGADESDGVGEKAKKKKVDEDDEEVEIMYGAPDDKVWTDKSHAQIELENFGDKDDDEIVSLCCFTSSRLVFVLPLLLWR